MTKATIIILISLSILIILYMMIRYWLYHTSIGGRYVKNQTLLYNPNKKRWWQWKKWFK